MILQGLCLCFLKIFLTNAFPYKLETEGSDLYQTIKLENDVVLYSVAEKVLKIHTSGLILLGNDSTVSRLRINDFPKNRFIIPYYSQMYVKKLLEIDVFTETKKVAFYNLLIHNHFVDEDAFQAREVISITWRNYMPFTDKQMQLIQSYIITDGRSSFLYTLFNASDSPIYNSFKFYIYGTPLAGFSAGDDFRYDIIRQTTSQNVFKEFFCAKSNFAQRGSWLYKLGTTNKYTAVIQSPNSLPGAHGPVDLNECLLTYDCDVNARCVNLNYNYACTCRNGYYGNGKICLKNGSNLFLRGIIHGNINGDSIDNVDNTILYQADEEKITITALPLAEGPGQVLLVLPHVFIPFAYMFAKSNSSIFSNGFEVTGHFLTIVSVIDFLDAQGEKLFIQQKVKRRTKSGYIPIDTLVSGRTPNFGSIANVRLENIQVSFTPMEGTLISKEKMKIIVNDKDYEIYVATAINYYHLSHEYEVPKHELEVIVETATYSLVKGIEIVLKPSLYFDAVTPKPTLTTTHHSSTSLNENSMQSTRESISTSSPLSNTITSDVTTTTIRTTTIITTTSRITTSGQTTTNRKTTTKIKESDDFLVFAQSGTIKRSTNPYNASNVEYLYTAYGDYLVGLDYDCESLHIYFTDATTGQVNRVDFQGNNVENVVSGLNFPEGLAIDKRHMLLYWTDSGDKSINIGSLIFKTKNVLFNENVHHPRGIIVHSEKGLVFWSDWDRKNPRIEVASTLGKDRQIFVDSKYVKAPNCLTFDNENNRICWTDADERRISCANLEGVKNVQVLANNLYHPFGLALSPNEVFWTDWKKNNRIQSMNSVNGQMVERPSGRFKEGRLYDIKYVKQCRQQERAED